MATRTDILVSINAKDSASRVLKGVGGSFKNLRNNINQHSLAISASITGVAIGIASFAKKSINDSINLGESINAMRVTFGEAGKEITEFAKTSATEVGLSMRQLNEAVVPLGAQLMNVGVSAEDAASKSLDLTKRAADLASVFNVELDEALVAVQAGLRGQTEPLTKFGVGLFDANVKQHALAEGIIETDREMTQQEKTLARLSLFFKQTEKTQGDFKNTSDDAANKTRILTAELEDQRAELGKELIPIQMEWLKFMRGDLIPFLDRTVLPALKDMSTGVDVVSDAWDNMTTKIAEVMIWFDKLDRKVAGFKEAHPIIGGKFLDDFFEKITGRATGGIVNSGQPFLVGERGPEMFVPHTSGKIEPNVKGGGGKTNITFEVNIGMYAGTETEKRNIASQLYGSMVRLGKSQNKSVSELFGG